MVSEICEVSSEIFYGTLWHEGKPISIRNRDQYFYIPEHLVAGLPDRITIVETEARVIKPKALATCKHCTGTGHYASDLDCPARAPEAIAATVKPFCGGKNPLSNLHECPEGCITPDGNHDFSSSEQHYQFKRLRHHGLINESYWVLEADSGFDAMKLEHHVLPEDDVQPS